MNEAVVKTPVHLWIVAVLAILWNITGATDYVMTQFQVESYMGQFTQEQLEYFYGFPAWVVAAWAVAVWGSLLGSFALLLKRAWAVWLFAAAVVGMVITSIHNFILTDGMAVMGQGGFIFSIIIWVVAIFLLLYARAMAKKGVLR